MDELILDVKKVNLEYSGKSNQHIEVTISEYDVDQVLDQIDKSVLLDYLKDDWFNYVN